MRDNGGILSNPQSGSTRDGLAQGKGLGNARGPVVLNVLHVAVLGEVIIVPADVVGGRLASRADRVSRRQTERWTGDSPDRHG